MALNNLGLGFIFTAKDLASQQMVRLGRSFQSFERQASRSLTRTQVALRQFAIGAGIALGGFLAIGGALNIAKGAGEFEQEMARVAAISDIATDSAEGTMLSTKALDSALKTQFSPTEAAEGLRNFASQGFNAQQQAESLEPALRLAQAGMIPVADAASSMTSALKVFGLEANQSADVTDKLLKITTKTSLQAEDLTLALGTVGRGAGLANQGLDEMLIAMGLVKNTGVDTSVAASSVSSALIFMGKNGDKFAKTLGVSVTKADGTFRDFTDVVLEANEQLGERFPNAAKRTKVASELFGRFGVTAFQAVSKQLENMKDAEGNLLPAEEAIKRLREEMGNAAGTAAEFESKILNTFEGQKKILEGVVQGLGVAVGKPFAAAIKPIITLVKDGVEGLVTFINAIPDDVKTTFARIALGLAAAAAGIGTLVALKGAITLIGSALAFLGVSISTVTGPLLLLVGLAATAGLVIAAFAADSERAGGGAVKSFTDFFSKVKLFFQGLVQFFSSGELSGEILGELNKAENEGVKSFLARVLSFGARMMEFFEGVKQGFKDFIREAGPVFDEFKLALTGLGESLGFVTGDLDRTQDPMKTFRDNGAQMGRVLGQVAVLIVQGLTLVIKTIGVVLTILDSLGLTVGDVVKIWLTYKAAMVAVKFASLDFGGAASGLIGNLKGIGGAVSGLPAKFAAARAGVNSFGAGVNATKGLLGKAGFVAAAGAAGFAIGTMLDDWLKLSDRIAGVNQNLRMTEEQLNKIGRTKIRGAPKLDDPGRVKKLAAQRGLTVAEFQKTRQAELGAEGYATEVDPKTGLINITGKLNEPGVAKGTPSAGAPVADVAGARGTETAGARGDASLDKIEKAIKEGNAELNRTMKQVGVRPVQVEAVVSEEAVAGARRDRQDRAFRPVPAEG
jgi:TP901 family phage tail tape measure protein